MSKKSNPITIGAFVVGAITLGIIGLMVFGSGRFFRETYEYILYFESDVSGLSKGANVKLKGVSIGTVREVLLNVGDMSALSGDHSKWYVPVIIATPSRIARTVRTVRSGRLARLRKARRVIGAPRGS